MAILLNLVKCTRSHTHLYSCTRVHTYTLIGSTYTYMYNNNKNNNNNTNNNNNGRNDSCLTWLATSLEEKRRWLIINASPRGQCSK